jgi:ADP-ribose pyrophosphatase YjhB (NUDIX family)
MELRDKKGLTEAEFLRQYNSDRYPKPSLTADNVLFSVSKEYGLEVLLIQRKGHPFMTRWAFPGGFADANEELSNTARRELQEETGLTGVNSALLGVYSAPGRDPRGWVVSAAYYTVVDRSRLEVKAGDDASDAEWFSVSFSEKGLEAVENSTIRLDKDNRGCFLAFDHDTILLDGCRAVANILQKQVDTKSLFN